MSKPIEFHIANCTRSKCQYGDQFCPVKTGEVEGHIDLTNERDKLVSIVFAAKEAALDIRRK